MTTLHFTIEINATKKKVWEILWNDSSYRQWTSAFSEGSYAVTDWKEGSKVQFLSPNGDGMFSTIAKSIPGELMSFKHLGVIALDEETKKWAGAMENYLLTENEGITTLAVDVDVTDEFTDFFTKTFPNALEKVKSLSEN